MTDEDFLSLSPGRANRALGNISDEAEIQRLQELYWEKNNVIVGSTSDVQTLARSVAPEPIAATESDAGNFGSTSDVQTLARNVAPESIAAAKSDAGSSRMLFLGRIIFVAAIAGAIISYIGVQNSDDFLTKARLVTALPICGIAFGFGALMWMMGAIEERLLEIRSILSARRKR